MAQVKILTLDNLKQVYNVIDSKIEASKVTKVSELANDANYATKAEAEGYATAAVAEVVNGAPETFDTLKEIADYIEAHGDVVDGLNAAIGNKADKSDVDDLKGEIAGFVGTVETKEHAEATYQPKGDYLTEHQDLSDYAKTADFVAYTEQEITDALNAE